MSKVDIIVTVYNGENFIVQCFNSILNQNSDDLNIILVNDGSLDDSLSLINNFDFGILNTQILNQQNEGVASALNRALELVRSDFVAFIDPDDIWEVGKIQKQVEYLKSHEEIDATFTLIQEFTDTSAIRAKARTKPMPGLCKTTFLGRKTAVEQVGKFDVSLPTGDFIDWMLRFNMAGFNYHIIPEVLAYRRVHNENLSLKNDKEDYLKLIHHHLKRRRLDKK